MKKALLISSLVALAALLMAQLSEPFNTYVNNLPAVSTPNNQFLVGDFTYVLRNGASAKVPGSVMRSPVVDGISCGSNTSPCTIFMANNSGGSNTIQLAPGGGPGLGSLQIANNGQPSNQITFPNRSGFSGQYMRSVGGGNTAMTYDYPSGQGNIAGRFGSMDVCQRGAGAACSFAVPASTTQYTVDGCYISTGANEAHTVSSSAGLNIVQSQNAQTTTGSNRSVSIQRNSGQTGISSILFGCPLDTDELSLPLGNFVNLSFVWSTGANFSPGSITFQYICGTGAPTKLINGFTNQVIVANGFVTTTAGSIASRSQATSAITVPTNCSQAEVVFAWVPVGTAGAADTVNIDSVQLEIVSTSTSIASPFVGIDFNTQLMLAQRHFQKTFRYGRAPTQNAGINTGEFYFPNTVAGAGTNWGLFRFPRQMRSPPASTFFNPAAANAQCRDEIFGGDGSATIANTITEDMMLVNCVGNAGTVLGNVLGVHFTLDSGI